MKEISSFGYLASAPKLSAQPTNMYWAVQVTSRNPNLGPQHSWDLMLAGKRNMLGRLGPCATQSSSG